MAFVAPQSFSKPRKTDENQGAGSTATNVGGVNVGQAGLNKDSSAGTSNTAAGAQRSPDEFTKSNFGSATAILDRNKNIDQSAVTNKITGDAQQQASTAQNAMDKTSQDYQTAQQAKQVAAPTTQQIASGVEGYDPEQFKATQQYLNNPQIKADSFNPGTFQPIQAADYLKSGDITSLLRQNNAGQGGYSAGMAALDNAAFGQSNGYQQIGEKVGSLQQQLEDKQAALVDPTKGTQATTQKQLDDFLNTQKGNIKGYLTGQQGTINSDLDAQVKKLTEGNTQQLAQLTQGNKAELTKKINDTVAGLQARLANPYEDKAKIQDSITRLQAASSNLDPYIQQYNPNVTANNVVSQHQADIMSNINQLLGTGGNIPTVAGPAGAPTSTIDQAGFAAAMSKLLSGSNESATAAQQAKEAADAAAAAKAAADLKAKQVATAQTLGTQGVAAPTANAPSASTPIGIPAPATASPTSRVTETPAPTGSAGAASPGMGGTNTGLGNVAMNTIGSIATGAGSLLNKLLINPISQATSANSNPGGPAISTVAPGYAAQQSTKVTGPAAKSDSYNPNAAYMDPATIAAQQAAAAQAARKPSMGRRSDS